MLRNRHRHIEDVGLLKGIAPEHGDIHLPRDRDHRDRVHVRRRKSRHEIRRTRSRRCDADPDAPRRTRISIRCVGGILLVRHKNLAYILLCIKRIVKRQDHPTRVTEQSIHTLLAQTRQNRLRTSHTHASNIRYDNENIIAYERYL